jgi:ankyrin repeat protein
VGVVRLLLEHGANPNAREAGDNASPLHWAAAGAHLEVMRALLDAGADVHGTGDAHQLDVIGWALLDRIRGGHSSDKDASQAAVSLLCECGARHHIFSAIASGDLDLVQRLVEEAPELLDRRLSRFEQGQTPLHFALRRKRYDILDLLIELGADMEAEDLHGQSVLAVAMRQGDREAMRRLYAAGANQPIPPASGAGPQSEAALARMADSISKGVPMIYVPDVALALEWYTAIGFKELGRYEHEGLVNFGMVAFGKAELMLNLQGRPGSHDVSLWFYTDQIEGLYQALKARQLDLVRSAGSRPGNQAGFEFGQELEDMFYGARQFCIRDPNGYELYFIQSVDA